MALFRRKNKNSRPKSERSVRPDASQQRVISYYTASRRQLDNFERTSAQSDKSLAYRPIEQLRSSWFVIFISIILMVLVGYLGSLSKVPHISIKGTQYRSTADYQKKVEQAFGSDIRNRVKPLLQTVALENAIAEVIPEAKLVNVKSNFLGHRPEVTLITDEPLAILSQPGSVDYILSTRGRVLLSVTETTIATLELPLIQNLTGLQGKAGEQFMRPDETTSLIRLLSQYAVDRSKPLFTLTTTPHEILAKETGRGTYSVRYLLSDTVTSQYGSLRATEKKLAEISQTPAEYIDVRLVDKAYYK